jgi:hypothetical protein
MPDQEKRETLKIIGTIGIQCAFPFAGDELWGQHVHVPAGKSAALPKPAYFDSEDLALVARVAELIIPGATAAEVPAYIDLVVTRNPEHQRTFTQGLAWLKAQNFASLPEAAQLGLLRPLCEAVDAGDVSTPERAFFRAAKSLTADGFFTSRPGLVGTLGYQGNQVLAEFPECTIEEH